MNQSTINTVLFDLDGTLINTNELIIASFQHTLDHYYLVNTAVRISFISLVHHYLIHSLQWIRI